MLMSIIMAVAILVVIYIRYYNKLVASKTKVQEGWSGITVQLKRRHALVGNLVSTVKSAMAHENAIIDKILAARTDALKALAYDEPKGVTQAETALTSALTSFVGYTEDNPEITANENIRLLQTQLEETEDQIAASRRLYNGNVQIYNTRILSIPSNFIANFHGFKSADMFDVDAKEKNVINQDPVINL